jgi:hypothetical protein
MSTSCTLRNTQFAIFASRRADASSRRVPKSITASINLASRAISRISGLGRRFTAFKISWYQIGE